jgi:glycerol-3-phosphate dehydrogenase
VHLKTEVVIIGGGSTGTGIARDLALRGIPSVLLERGDFTSGASGRNHGLLHSGARYVVSDREAARECITENRILKTIAPHCIEATGGFFVSLPEDSLYWRDSFIRACMDVGIEADPLQRDDVLQMDPAINPALVAAVRVPDGAVDPFLLVIENARDAEKNGAKCLTHVEVTELLATAGRIRGVMARDTITGEPYDVEAPFVVNATGAWADHILKLARLHLGLILSKGSMLITNRRLCRHVINRCRPPGDGDIIVPNETVSILGTTSVTVDDISRIEVTLPEVSQLIEAASDLIPAVRTTRFIRAYAGVRPLFQFQDAADGRAVSREFVLVDHGAREGLSGLTTITGGKLIRYRLMAEKVCDLLCEKMGIRAECKTSVTPLPGAERPFDLSGRLKEFGDVPLQGRGETLCDCELIGRDEIEGILRQGHLRNLQDILHRTRLAKGTCQGAFCVYRLLGVLQEHGLTQGEPHKILKGFLEERWKGVRPILGGLSLREEELIESIYRGLFNL